jgi:uncharacterized protein involved in exopolysaccharide biosynthesis
LTATTIARDGKEGLHQQGPRRSPISPLVPVVLGAVVFAVLAWLFTLAGATDYRGTARLSVHPDPPLTEDPGTVSPEQADRFVQGEVLVINGGGFRREMAQRTQGPEDIPIEASQVAATDVVELSATADGPRAAAALANLAVEAYVERRAEAASIRLRDASTEIAAQLAETSRALEGLAATDAQDPTIEARRAALEGELTRLVALDNELRLQGVEGASAVEVIDQAHANDAVRLSRPLWTAFLGALLGAAVGLLASLVLQRQGVVDRWDSGGWKKWWD